MSQIDKANQFASLHQQGNPVILYNAWDAGSAKAIAEAGAPAIASGSWSLAAAQGYADGQQIPFDAFLEQAKRMCDAADNLPCSIDFEGGFAETADQLKSNSQALMKTGAIGVNFEDQIVSQSGIYSIEEQSTRIRSVREAAEEMDLPLFLNARTDFFLKERDPSKHADLLGEAIARASAYQEAGASGFFVPGLVDPKLIGNLCEQVKLPVNVMMMEGAASVTELACLGVSRISFGPAPYFQMLNRLKEDYQAALAG